MSDSASERVVILDVLPHGRSDDDRPGYQKEPLAYAIGELDFQLYALTFDGPPAVSIGDIMHLEDHAEEGALIARERIGADDLSSGGQAELEYVIEEIVDNNEQRYVDFFNNAQPISLRLHQLNLLPGIGTKLRDTILDERKRNPFESFEELEERVNGLHDPRTVLIERITEELHDDDLKYYLFVGPEALLAKS